MKEVNGATAVDGENFSKVLGEGCMCCEPDGTPFQRNLGYIEARNKKLLSQNNEMGQGNFRPYDDTNTVNQS